MESFKADVAIIGAGGAGLRAAIAVAESDPALKIALISKVYPMRSHTVAAEGGAAGVVLSHDSLEHHFHDTVAGGDWLCEQDVVDYFVAHCAEEMVQMEQSTVQSYEAYPAVSRELRRHPCAHDRALGAHTTVTSLHIVH